MRLFQFLIGKVRPQVIAQPKEEVQIIRFQFLIGKVRPIKDDMEKLKEHEVSIPYR